MPTLDALAQKLASASRILITTHMLPDGDGLGSQMGLTTHLQALGKEVIAINNDPTPQKFEFVDPKKQIEVFSPAKTLPNADLVLVVDTHDWKMLGQMEAVLRPDADKVWFLDHHASDGGQLVNQVIDESCRATGELAFKLTCALGGTISIESATAFAVALITDVKTLGFMGATQGFHETMAKLFEKGVDVENIYRRIYANDSYEKIKLLGHLLDNIRVKESGKLAWLEIPLELRQRYGASVEDTESYIDLLTRLRKTEVALLFREEENGLIKVSLRGLQGNPVLPVAEQFGGGGHQFAAGMRVKGALSEVITKVLSVVGASRTK